MDIETEIERLHAGSKSFAAAPSWHCESRGYEKLIFSTPLDIDYVTEEGLYLDGWCFSNAPEMSVTLTLLYKPPTGLSGPIARLDWKPVHDHANKGRVDGEWRWKTIIGTHLHGYEMNRSQGWTRMVQGNLPVALPVLDDPSDFRGMLGYAGIWNVRDMQRVPVPAWQTKLALS